MRTIVVTGILAGAVVGAATAIMLNSEKGMEIKDNFMKKGESLFGTLKNSFSKMMSLVMPEHREPAMQKVVYKTHSKINKDKSRQ